MMAKAARKLLQGSANGPCLESAAVRLGIQHARHTCANRSGYITAPWLRQDGQGIAAIRHGTAEEAWEDADAHLHSDSEEVHFVLAGELQLLIGGAPVTLVPGEILLVKERIPHIVVGGRGLIEHFVIPAPALDDRQTVTLSPLERPVTLETES